MKVFTGTALKELIRLYNLKQYKKRYCFKKLKQYLHSKKDNKVCILYGLLGTGKTTLVMQAIEELNDYDNCCLIQCKHNDDMYMVTKEIKAHPNCKYIFILEVTKLENFINTASVLADRYATYGKKIILSGTASLSFIMAAREELYEKTTMIHTTYISYEEYHHLLDENFENYMLHGGIFTDDFKTAADSQKYIQTAIVYNIYYSLEHTGRGGKFGVLSSLYDYDKLPNFIIDVLKNLANPVFEIEGKSEEIEVVKSYLKLLDCIYYLPNFDEAMFVQPGLKTALRQLIGL